MKQRTSSQSNARTRGTMNTRRSRSTLPATTRRPKSSSAKHKSATGRSRSRTRSSGTAQATTDHDEIRRWVESHGGTPSIVKGTSKGQGGGILRIDFPGFSGEKSLRKVSWNQWFKVFDQRKLAFLHQQSKGKQGRFNKLVSRGK